MVDVLMEVYPVYRKERTMVQEFIDNQGLSYTWDKVLEMRTRVDSLETAEAGRNDNHNKSVFREERTRVENSIGRNKQPADT